MRRWAEYFEGAKEFITKTYRKIETCFYVYPWMSRSIAIVVSFLVLAHTPLVHKATPVLTTMIVSAIFLFMIGDTRSWFQNWMESFNKRIGNLETQKNKDMAKEQLLRFHHGAVHVGYGVIIKPHEIRLVKTDGLRIRIYHKASAENMAFVHVHECQDHVEQDELMLCIERALNFKDVNTGKPIFEVSFSDPDTF